MKNMAVVVAVGIVLLFIFVGLANMGDRSRTRQQPISTNSDNGPVAKIITDYCSIGRVMLWESVDTGEVLYELRDVSVEPSFEGTYDFYDSAGQDVGTANWTDTDSFILDDGSRGFCSHNGRACPKFIGEYCSS